MYQPETRPEPVKKGGVLDPNIPNLQTWKSSIPSFQTLQRQALMSRFNESMGWSPAIGCATCDLCDLCLWVGGNGVIHRGRKQIQGECGERGAAAHARAPGLSTGRRLMPMPARCGAAAPCHGERLSFWERGFPVGGPCFQSFSNSGTKGPP